MRHQPIPTAVLAAALCACSAQQELLNSDRIEQRFGSYGIEVLQQDDRVRRSSLYSVDDGVRTCRTYAVVEYHAPLATELASAHAAIVAGDSIGATLRMAGWEISKETLYVGHVQLPDASHGVARLMRLDGGATLGLHAYRLRLDKDQMTVWYATIIEAHHPDYMSEADLIRLFADDAFSKAYETLPTSIVDLVLQ